MNTENSKTSEPDIRAAQPVFECDFEAALGHLFRGLVAMQVSSATAEADGNTPPSRARSSGREAKTRE